jgi:hypothetical protein
MAYIGKIAFIIDGITIHSSLFIPFNCKDLSSLSSERLDNLVKKYDRLQLIALDEILLIGKRITKFINLRLRLIKCIHTKVFGNLDVIINGDFYQVQLVCDVGIFKINANNINSLTPNFWMENIMCYELKQIMCHIDEQFVNILNQFRTTTQLQSNVDTINN